MKKEIYQMSSDEALNESIKLELKNSLQKARNACKRADEELRKVYNILEDMCIDLDVTTNAENADNLEQAVNCYVQYGEYNLKGLVSEIMKQYNEDLP
jgi:hypothetical protein